MKQTAMSKEDKKMLNAIYWRSMFLSSGRCGGQVRMHAVGFINSILPALKRYYKDDKERYREALMRHTTYFNMTQHVSTFCMGLVASMEKEAAEDNAFDTSSIAAVKTSLMGPMSGIGDSIFWGVLRLLAASIAITFAASGSILAPISFLLIFNVPAFICRYYLTYKGFSLGTTFLSDMQKSGTIQILTKAASILGLVMIGAMVASTVTFKCALSIPVENADPISIQTYLDSIFKGLVPLTLTLGCLYAQMKKININLIMLMVLALAMVLALLGVV